MTHIFSSIPLFRLARSSCVAIAISPCLFAQASPAAAPGTPVAAPAAASAQETPKFVRYLKVGANGTQARNLGDANGVSLGTLPAGSLVAVYKEQGEWLECEVPGGFEIWVFGQYVKVSAEAGVLEITGSDVRARPLPSPGPESYPLQPNLSKGDRVRLITRKDSSKSLAEDWVKVYSPPGVRAFVAKADCESLPTGTDGAQAWANAVVESRKRKAAPAGVILTGAGAAAAGSGSAAVAGDLTPQQAIEELQRADAALAQQRRAEQPNFAPVREQYQRVLASTKEGATADLARRGLSEVEALIELQAIQATLLAERERAQADAERRRIAMEQAANNPPDLYGGRFDTRGWLEKRVVPGQAPVYLLRWGGESVAEIQCNSGRYELSDFNGCELGIKGRQLRDYVPGDIGRVAVPRLFDASRIEILAGKAKSR